MEGAGKFGQPGKIGRMKQWHPLFAQLLRPAVENYYEVRTTLPVGDAPREADFVLLRRTSQATPPFRGLWRHLTTWNILEFKGPTVSPRHGDIELLVELGLGIDRRLRKERGRKRQRPVVPEEVSFWYLANRLGHRFVLAAERKLSGLDPLGAGLWRCRLLGRLVFLVSSIHLPVEEDSLPLHIVGREPAAVEREVARLVIEEPGLQQLYGGWVASLHPSAWKEVAAMARAAGKPLNIDLRPPIEMLGLDRVIEQVGIDRLIEQCGEREVIKRIGLDRWLANLTSAERRELKRRLQ
ncbi:MAG TPA: hypothetical protein VG013_29955 [Gemmataceae bacterium]|nr:hypothetical protein [Gemmataceae bacterium]